MSSGCAKTDTLSGGDNAVVIPLPSAASAALEAADQVLDEASEEVAALIGATKTKTGSNDTEKAWVVRSRTFNKCLIGALGGLVITVALLLALLAVQQHVHNEAIATAVEQRTADRAGSVKLRKSLSVMGGVLLDEMNDFGNVEMHVQSLRKAATTKVKEFHAKFVMANCENAAALEAPLDELLRGLDKDIVVLKTKVLTEIDEARAHLKQVVADELTETAHEELRQMQIRAKLKSLGATRSEVRREERAWGATGQGAADERVIREGQDEAETRVANIFKRLHWLQHRRLPAAQLDRCTALLDRAENAVRALHVQERLIELEEGKISPKDPALTKDEQAAAAKWQSKGGETEEARTTRKEATQREHKKALKRVKEVNKAILHELALLRGEGHPGVSEALRMGVDPQQTLQHVVRDAEYSRHATELKALEVEWRKPEGTRPPIDYFTEKLQLALADGELDPSLFFDQRAVDLELDGQDQAGAVTGGDAAAADGNGGSDDEGGGKGGKLHMLDFLDEEDVEILAGVKSGAFSTEDEKELVGGTEDEPSAESERVQEEIQLMDGFRRRRLIRRI